MIVTVTPNIAIDRTYRVERVEIGTVHKVRAVHTQTGGKGVNVSRTVAALGRPTLVTGLFGGAGLGAAAQDLRTSGVESDLYSVAGALRQTITVVADDATTTAFDEPGPEVTTAEWQGFEEHVLRLLHRAACVVISGSLPPGAPDEAFRRLVAAAHEHAVPTIVDGRGPHLRAALANEPLIAKLNKSELSETVGRPCRSDEDIIDGAWELRALGARAVIVTLGPAGAIGLQGQHVWRVTHPARTGNPIGAGDAFTAGVAVAISDGRPFGQALHEGAAAALASLGSPTAGHLDVSDLEAASLQVTTRLLGNIDGANVDGANVDGANIDGANGDEANVTQPS